MRRVVLVGALAAMPLTLCLSSVGDFWTPRAFAEGIAAGSSPVQVSQCGPGSQGAEVEEAVDQRYVYDLWMARGCGEVAPSTVTISFARSTDGGRQFGPTFTLPGSFSPTSPNTSSWDPAIAVAPDGTVYAAFMFFNPDTEVTSPVVAASFDQGRSFSQVSYLPVPPFTDPLGNQGDRDFIAVGRDGTVYVTWDYGPSYSEVQNICASPGAISCSYSAGDFNAVIQKSTDGGKTWTSVHPISPGFPLGGALSAPILVQPDGTIDVLYIDHSTDPSNLALSPGGEFFTRSSDGGQTWSTPVQVGPGAGTLSLTEWWIDGDISTDQAGDLYATWDAQSATSDIGWLSYSTDGGRTWSNPIRVTPARGDSEELVEVVGALPRTAYIAWQTPAAPQGYATFIRPFSIDLGWLASAPTQVSTQYGSPNIWPGDTFGLATLQKGLFAPSAVVSWGSAINGQPDQQIYGSVVPLWKMFSAQTASSATPAAPPRSQGHHAAPAIAVPSRGYNLNRGEGDRRTGWWAYR